MLYFRLFSPQKFQNHAVNFRALGHNCLGNNEKIFENCGEQFSPKIAKCIILIYFSKNLINHALIFCAFGQKRQFILNFGKIFKNFGYFSSVNSENALF